MPIFNTILHNFSQPIHLVLLSWSTNRSCYGLSSTQKKFYRFIFTWFLHSPWFNFLYTLSSALVRSHTTIHNRFRFVIRPTHNLRCSYPLSWLDNGADGDVMICHCGENGPRNGTWRRPDAQTLYEMLAHDSALSVLLYHTALKYFPTMCTRL